jgi:choice-of-anchor A domain-containing protein
MMKVGHIVLAFLFIVLVTGETASAAMFGVAGDYNLFTLGSATLTVVENSDAGGSIAIGGDAKLTSYAVASQRSGNDARLVVGGHLTYSNGQVGINGSGTIYAQTATLTGTSPTDFETTGNGVDFNDAADYLTTASTFWGSLSATGTTTVHSWGAIELNGSDSNLNVFDLNGSDLLAANSFNITAPTGSTMLVNISGEVSGMTNMGFDLTGVENTNILYNFYEATDLKFEGIGIQGSVLAPLAAVDFDYGSINGQMIAYTLGSEADASSGKFHDISFTGQLTPVPIPSAVWLFCSGLVVFVGLRKKSMK